MFNEKNKVQISGHDVLPFCRKKEKELMFIFYHVCIKYHWKIQRKPIEVVTYGRKG